MTLKFARRVAAQILKRGESAIRFNSDATEEIGKALTREDIRRLVGEGKIIALKAKDNVSRRSKILRQKRAEGRKRGPGRRKGTSKARRGSTWEKKVRSQRIFLKQLRMADKLDSKSFRKFYMLIKGNAFNSKASMLLHMKEQGISVSEAEVAKINENIKKMYE
ncbi:MAG: 50S ribosomal protein L19e [Candidatus Micrarchaeota archaeon]|nr:50S ribosomal protein L19e [Candidatus Micrarchaeota archaeon]MDE1804488.1 50S ribosomal protein L19e [Candidatus Micrarchaeota archaeon]MDE1846455.1 50S ribosomal protein L19e [Candidatus Micrarchaeota archaeon]